MSPALEFFLRPVVDLSIFLALIYTLAVHLFMRLGFRGLLWHWLLASGGMAGGYALAVRANSRLPMVGDMHVIESSAAALALLVLVGLRVRLTRVA